MIATEYLSKLYDPTGDIAPFTTGAALNFKYKRRLNEPSWDDELHEDILIGSLFDVLHIRNWLILQDKGIYFQVTPTS